MKVYSVGPENAKESIRKALAMGADEGVLMKDDNERDSIGIATALADEIKNDGCEIVFCGKQSVDYDNSIIGQLVAEILDYSSISVVVNPGIIMSKATISGLKISSFSRKSSPSAAISVSYPSL